MRLREFFDALEKMIFPLRSDLRKEVDYLKAQVAYHQRRADVLEAKLFAALTPQPVVRERREPQPLPKVITSWESYKRYAKETNDGSEEAAQGDEAITDATGTAGA